MVSEEYGRRNFGEAYDDHIPIERDGSQVVRRLGEEVHDEAPMPCISTSLVFLRVGQLTAP